MVVSDNECMLEEVEEGEAKGETSRDCERMCETNTRKQKKTGKAETPINPFSSCELAPK